MKKLPKFKTEDEEREFWDRESPLDYFHVEKARRATFPNLRPTTRSISIRLPESMLDALRNLANRYDVPYQSMIKIILAKGIEDERRMRKA